VTIRSTHVFLFGDRQVGKTTAIHQFLRHDGLTADGIMTFWQLGDGEPRLFLSPYLATGRPEQQFQIAVGRPMDATQADAVFDTAGVQILDSCGQADVIVMDELGFLESGAPAFQEAVMRHIMGDVPIVGVLKRSPTPFLDSLRAHPRIKLLEVTLANRDLVPDAIRGRILDEIQ